MQNNINIWQYNCQENYGTRIRLMPFICGKIKIVLQDDCCTNNAIFSISDFVSILPLVKKAVDKMNDGDFEITNSSLSKDIKSVNGKSVFRIVPFEEEVFSLQLFSKETMFESSVVIDLQDLESFVRITEELKEAA